MVKRSELLDQGLSRGRIDWMVSSGRLELVHRGLYLVRGQPTDSRDEFGSSPNFGNSFDQERARAHLAGCGPGAVLSHHSAAALHGFDTTHPRPSAVYVSAGRTCGVRGNSELLITRPRYQSEVTLIQGFATTSRAQTVLDLAAIVPPVELRRILESALRGTDPRRPDQWRTDVLLNLDRLTIERPRSRGATALIQLLATRPPNARPTGSLPETVLWQALESCGIEVIPQPTLRVHVGEHQVHVYFPDQLILGGHALVEVDGAEHLEPQRAYTDAIRQNRLVGFHLFRFPASRVLHRTDEVVAELVQHVAMTPSLGNQWTVAGRVVSGAGNEWTIRPAG